MLSRPTVLPFKMSQLASTVMMVRPSNFGYNEETAKDNHFQERLVQEIDTKEQAKKEFDQFVTTLKRRGVNVQVLNDTLDLPDSTFPNNWVSFHSEDKRLVIYPMKCKIRRSERKKLPDVLNLLQLPLDWSALDLSHYEERNQFLEGTGSMVLDREHKLAYACLSERTHPKPLKEFCDIMGYKPVMFEGVLTTHGLEAPIYHTNVMMSVGENIAIVCYDAFKNPDEQLMVKNLLRDTGKTVVEISGEQVKEFAGNMLQIKNTREEAIMVMSSRAYHSLRYDQLRLLQTCCQILHTPLPVIETLGGGSARCMLAEVFK